jgi:DNA-binding response OmpR family regulator
MSSTSGGGSVCMEPMWRKQRSKLGLHNKEPSMPASLAGSIVLVVEDEALIAMDIQQAFERSGATVILARTLKDGLMHAENSAITAAIIDHSLHDGVTTSDVCDALQKRHIPFIVYSGFSEIHGVCAKGELVHKPANPALLVTTLQGAIAGHGRHIH